MKKVKIKADLNSEFNGKITYPNGENVDIIPLNQEENNLTNELIEITTYENGKKHIFKLRCVERNGLKYMSRMPNPLFILLNSSIENYNNSEFYLSTFIKNSDKVGENTYRLFNNKNGTSDVYNKFIESKIVSINSLINSLEIFMNQKIPNDYKFKQENNSKSVTLNKKRIEQGVTFKDKLEKILPEIFPKYKTKILEINNILEAYSIRRELTHMKTNGTDIFEQYFEIMGKLIDSDIEKYIKSSIHFMNNIEPKLIEFE